MTFAADGLLSTFGLALPAGSPPQTRGPIRTSAAPASQRMEGAGIIRRLAIALALTSCAFTLWWARAADASTVSQARAEVHRLWGAQAPRMLCIIGRESSWNPRAVSRTDDHGLVQLNRPSWQRYFGARWNLRYDPVENVRMGYRVWRIQGFGAWTTARWC